MRYRPEGDSYQIRTTTGWWSTQWMGADNDIAPWNMAERIIDNGDGTYYIEVTFGDDPIVGAIDVEHVLFTGSGFTPLELYIEEEIWIDGPGDQEVKVPVWTNDGSLGETSWGGEYRFAPEFNSTGEECYTVPEDVWARLKSETFYVTVQGANPQIRVTSGWWSTQWMGADNDIKPGNELLEDLGDGIWRLTVNLEGDPLVNVIDAEHLLFTGSGYSVQEIYFVDVVPGGGGGPKEVVLWQGDGSAGIASDLRVPTATTSVSLPSRRKSGISSRPVPSTCNIPPTTHPLTRYASPPVGGAFSGWAPTTILLLGTWPSASSTMATGHSTSKSISAMIP